MDPHNVAQRHTVGHRTRALGKYELISLSVYPPCRGQPESFGTVVGL